MTVDGLSPFTGEPKEDDARLVENPEGEDVADVEIEREDDAAIPAGALDEFEIRTTLQSQCAHMDRLVSEFSRELDGPGRDSSVGQKSHRSGVNGMQFVLRECRRIGERLADVVGFEFGKVVAPQASGWPHCATTCARQVLLPGSFLPITEQGCRPRPGSVL